MLGSAPVTAVSLRFTSQRRPLCLRRDPEQRGKLMSTHVRSRPVIPWKRQAELPG